MLSKDTNEHKNNHTLSETINILYNEIEHLKKRVELLENIGYCDDDRVIKLIEKLKKEEKQHE